MKALMVASIGGHLTQLHELHHRIVDPSEDEILWVTHDSPQSRSMLEGHDVLFVPYIGERDLLGVLRTVPTAIRTIRERRPDIVVSTGSAIALAFLPIARAMGHTSAFIESAAMVEGHTRTGRALRFVPGVDLYSQSPTEAHPRWSHIGSVFDGFRAEPVVSRRPVRRIVVTVGTSQEFGFRNMIEAVASIVPDDVEVLWQTGCTDVSGLEIDATPWLPAAELEAAMRDADVVVSHAGCGSALAALANGRRPVLVARRSDRGEFRDDHQFLIAERLDGVDLATQVELETLVWDDMVEAAAWTVRRDPCVAPLHLTA